MLFFLSQVDAGEVESVVLSEERIIYVIGGGETIGEPQQIYNTVRVNDPDLVQRLQEAGSSSPCWVGSSPSYPCSLSRIFPMP